MKKSAAAGSKHPKSKLRRLLWLLPLSLLLLCIIACHHVYSEYIAPWTGELYFVTFEPFSGRLFLFDDPQRQVSVEYGDGSAYKDAGVEIRIYKDRLEVGGVDYYCDSGWLQELWDMMERPGQPMPRGIPQ